MIRFPAMATALAIASSFGAQALAQVGNPASPRVGSPATQPAGPPAPDVRLPGDLPNLVPREGPLPANLTLEQALEEAEARSPAISAARSSLAAAQSRLRQAGFRPNPELSVELEDFLGTGDLSGLRSAQLTVAVNQRLDLGGRRGARQAAARAAIAVAQLNILVTRADLGQSIRQQFATAVAARERLRIATDREERTQELARIAGILVDAGREPPLRALRARAAATQASANRRAIAAEEAVARFTLASLFGVETPPASVVGSIDAVSVQTIAPDQSLEARLAQAELALAQANLQQELAATRLDPAVGVGIRRNQEVDDQAFVAGFSLPLQIRNRNQGNIAAARAEIAAAQARLAGALARAGVRINNASVNRSAADIRVRALETAAVPEAREALRLAELSYRAGKIPLLELLDAQNALASVEADLVEARLARAQASAEFSRAIAQ